MADNTNITDIEQRAVDKFKSLGWATEDTLSRLLRNSGSTLKILGEISKQNPGIDKDLIDRLVKGMDGVGKAVKATADRIDDPITARADTTERKKQTEAIKGLGLGVTGTIRDAFTNQSMTMGRVFADLGGHVKSFGRNVGETRPVLGGVLQALGTMGSLVGSLIQTMSDMNDITRRLHASGVIVEGGFNELAASAGATGVSIGDLSKNLQAFSGVAVTLGTRRVTAMAAAMAQQTRRGADLMMTQEELQRAFLETTEMTRLAGGMETMTQEQITARSRNLLQTFNDLSIATGRNRDEIRQATLAIAAQRRMYGLQARIGPEMSSRFQEMIGGLTATFGREGGEAMAQMVEQVMSGGGGFALLEGPLGQAARAMPDFARALQEITANVDSGAISQEEATRRIRDTILGLDRNALATMRQSTDYREAADAIFGLQQQARQAADAEQRRASMTDAQRQEEERNLNAQRDQQSAYNNARAALNEMSTTFYRLANELMGPVVIPLMNTMAEGMRSLVSWLTPERMRAIGEGVQTLVGVLTNMSPGLAIAAVLGILAAPAVISAVTAMAVSAAAAAGGGGLASLAGGGRGRLLGRVAGTAALAIGGGMAIDAGASALGVGGNQIDARQDEENWQRMSFGQRLESGAARTIETIGGLFGLSSFVNEAQAARIRNETAYFAGRPPATPTAPAAGGQPAAQTQAPAQPIISLPAGFTADQIIRLSEIPSANLQGAAQGITSMRQALESLQPAMLVQLGQALQQFATIDPAVAFGRLAAAATVLADATPTIREYVGNIRNLIELLNQSNLDRLRQITEVFDRMAATFRQGINTRQVQPLVSAVTSLVRGVSEAAPAGPAPITPAISADELNIRTMRYYDETTALFRDMYQALEKSNDLLERLDNNGDSRARDIVSAIDGMSGRIGP